MLDTVGKVAEKPFDEFIQNMFLNYVYQKNLILGHLDGYLVTSKEMILQIQKMDKIYYCPLKDNRQMNNSNSSTKYPHQQLKLPDDKMHFA